MNEERMPADRGDDQRGGANGKNNSNSPKDTLGAPKEKPQVHNPRELDDARYAALDCRAHSDRRVRLWLL